MFYYYGRKKRISHLYPPPTHDTIIEPFAGSAAYSLHGNNWEKKVTISDTNPTVIGIWDYLKNASVKDIIALPDFNAGEKITDHAQLSEAERDLIGLHINPGSSIPKITCSKFSRWKAGKQYILGNLYKIKHWTILGDTYTCLKNAEATWFIDPPYQKAGIYYAGGNPIDFNSLGLWCKSRHGQVIVCESEGADWLPFEFLTSTTNVGQHRCKEVLWLKP